MLGVATGFPLDLFDLTSGEEKFEDITIPSGGFPLDLLHRSELAVELLVVVTSSIVGRENYKSAGWGWIWIFKAFLDLPFTFDFDVTAV